MTAQCPACHRPAVLDLHASMFHRARDFYSCQRCDQTWAVEKRTGKIIRLDAAQTLATADATINPSELGADIAR
jgi:hypothetical protein